MDCSRTLRRPGSETGPSQFCKILKFSHLKAIGDPHSTYLNCFSYIGTDMHLFKQSSFTSKFAALHDHLQARDTVVCVGGDSSILPVMTAIDGDFDVIVKVSPCLSRQSIADDGKRDHANYVSSMDGSLRAKIVHFGLLDNLNSQSDVDIVLNEDKAKIMFLDKFGKTNVQAFNELLSGLTPKTKLGVMIDCESLTPDYFPGVTNPSIFGLDEKEIFGIMEKIGSIDVRLKMLLFANYNATVESTRSGDVLTYLIYSFLAKYKVAGSSVLAALPQNDE